MRSRQGVTELFTTFLLFDADKATGWAADPKLRRSFVNSQKSLAQSENSEDYWLYYWYKQWQSQPDGLAKSHLSAYLQEPCYWVAHKTIANVASSQYTLSDCFQIVIQSVDKVLKGYKPQMGFNLKNYASAIFHSELKETLRQQNEIDICTNWRLLRKITQKRLVESLENSGLNPDIVHRYVLAWKAYQALYAPQQPSGTRKLPKPDQATWEAIAKFYNQERHTLPAPGPQLSPETMEKWMTSCAKAVRSYFYPNVASLNAPRGGDEDGDEFLDNLPQYKQESLMSEMIVAEEMVERRSQQSQINDYLATAIKELDPEAQKIVELYYSQGLTQQEIAKQLDIKQYTISRRLTKSRDTLLLKLASWCKDSLHISLNPTVLNYISTVMEEWLKAYYSRPLSQLEQ